MYSYISDFWFRKQSVCDDSTLRQEVGRLPPMDELTPQQLKRIPFVLSSIAKRMRSGNKPPYAATLWREKLERNWTNAVQSKLPSCSADDLAGLAYSFVELGNVPSRAFLVSFFYEAKQKIAALPPTDPTKPRIIANIFCSCAALSLCPPISFLSDSCDEAEKIMPAFDAKYLTDIAYAAAVLSVAPEPSFMAKLADETNAKAAGFTPELKVRMLWALAAFSVFTTLPDSSHSFIRDAMELDPALLTTKGRYALAVARLRFDPENAARIALPPEENIVSADERRFAVRLKSAGFAFSDHERFFRSLHKDIDYVVKAGDRTVLIEFDGPYHFIHDLEGNPAHFSGKSRLMAAVMQSRRPESVVLRLPCWAADTIGAKQLRTLRTELEMTEPGVYYLFHDFQHGAYTLDPIPVNPPPAIPFGPSRRAPDVPKEKPSCAPV